MARAGTGCACGRSAGDGERLQRHRAHRLDHLSGLCRLFPGDHRRDHASAIAAGITGGTADPGRRSAAVRFLPLCAGAVPAAASEPAFAVGRLGCQAVPVRQRLEALFHADGGQGESPGPAASVPVHADAGGRADGLGAARADRPVGLVDRRDRSGHSVAGLPDPLSALPCCRHDLVASHRHPIGPGHAVAVVAGHPASVEYRRRGVARSRGTVLWPVGASAV